MLLPVLSKFSFKAKKATVAERLNILNWLGLGGTGLTVSGVDDGDSSATLTIQLVDANGDALAEADVVVDYIIGGSADTVEDIGTQNGLDAGTVLVAHTADAHYTAVTDANGQVVIDFTPTAPDDVFITAWAKGQAARTSVTVA